MGDDDDADSCRLIMIIWAYEFKPYCDPLLLSYRASHKYTLFSLSNYRTVTLNLGTPEGHKTLFSTSTMAAACSRRRRQAIEAIPPNQWVEVLVNMYVGNIPAAFN